MNCYVLTGGRSRRMGQSKPEMFLERVIAAARGAFDEVIIVDRPECGGLPPLWSAGACPRGGSELPHSKAAASRRTPTIFEAPHEDEGPIFGIRAALQHAETTVFILAVDYPLITTEVLRYLRDRGGVPVWRNRPQPLCAVYDAALLPLIESRIEQRSFKVRDLIEETIPESELRARFAGEPLLNVNTPEELQEAMGFDERLLASR